MAKRFYEALSITIPLLFAFLLLLFAAQTEWWRIADYSKLDTLNDKHISFIEKEQNYKYVERRIRFKKYSGLFGDCYEFKSIKVIVPFDSPDQNEDEELNTCHIINNSREFEANCFICKNSEQAIPREKECDDVPDCDDASDELGCMNLQRNDEKSAVSFFHSFYDTKNACYRHKYNLVELLIEKFKTSNSTSETEKLSENNYFLNCIFLMLLGIFLCYVFSLLNFFTLIFIKCCNYIKDSNVSAKGEYYFTPMEESTKIDEYDYDDDARNIYISKKFNCCKCTYILCPFAFYSVFSLLSFFCCLLTLISYLIIVFTDYKNMMSEDIYRLNSWLFNVHKFSVSFYALLASCFFYALTAFISIIITCRIQISPGWRSRYSDTYEVMQIQQTSQTELANNLL